MGRLVVCACALLSTGCGGFFFGVDTSESQARAVPIFNAAIDCDLAALRRLIPSALHARDADGSTALHWSLYRDCKEGVLLLLEAGADPNAEDRFKRSLLASAAAMKDVDLLDAFVRRGGDVNQKDSHGMLPLHYAAGSGSVETVRYLLAHGADIRAADQFGNSALHTGAPHGALVEALIAAGADANARARNGGTPLMNAASWFMRPRTGGSGVRALLKAGADVHAVTDEGATALLSAVERFDPEAVKDLLHAGADVNARSRTGETPLRVLRHRVANTRGLMNLVWSLVDSDYRDHRRSMGEVEQVLLAAGAVE